MKSLLLITVILFSGVVVYGQSAETESVTTQTETPAVVKPTCAHHGSATCSKECCAAKSGKKMTKAEKKACKEACKGAVASNHNCPHHALENSTAEKGTEPQKACCPGCTHACCAKSK